MTNYQVNLSFTKILKLYNQIHDKYALYPLIPKLQPDMSLYDQYITKNNLPCDELRMCTVPLHNPSQYNQPYDKQQSIWRGTTYIHTVPLQLPSKYNQPYNKKTTHIAGTYVHAPFSTVPTHNPTTQLFWSHCYI